MACEMAAVDAKTGAPAPGFGRMNRTLQFVKEGVDWRISAYVISEEELARALIAAKTEQDRRTLFEQERELVNLDLVKALGRRQKKDCPSVDEHRHRRSSTRRLRRRAGPS